LTALDDIASWGKLIIDLSQGPLDVDLYFWTLSANHPSANDGLERLVRCLGLTSMGSKNHPPCTEAEISLALTKQGEDVIIVPAVSDADAKQAYPGGWKSPKPYIRIVPQPR